MLDTTKIDLNKPAFGAGSQSLEELMNDRTSDSAPVGSESEEETVEVENKEKESSVEETKVPYSRFKKYHDEAKQYQAEAEELKARIEKLELGRFETKDDSQSLPDYWVELYGDSEASEKAYKIQQRREQQLKDEARLEAIEAIRNERYQEQENLNSNLESIDDNLENLSDFVGRQITEKEESAILDIVDDYTPKDENGNYMGALLPFEKAWDIYQMKQQVTTGVRAKTRDSIASLSNENTQGDTNIEEKNKSFNPLDWNAYKRRL